MNKSLNMRVLCIQVRLNCFSRTAATRWRFLLSHQMSNAVSDYRPSCWLTCKLHDGTHFIFLYEPIPITQGESLFSFFWFYRGRAFHFSVGAFWWLMPLPLIFLCFINKRTDGYFMFPGTTATTAAVILQRPTKRPPFPNTLVCSILNVYRRVRTSYRWLVGIILYIPIVTAHGSNN